jgi:hypothetical protein
LFDYWFSGNNISNVVGESAQRRLLILAGSAKGRSIDPVVESAKSPHQRSVPQENTGIIGPKIDLIPDISIQPT